MHSRGEINMENKRNYCLHHHLNWLRCQRKAGRHAGDCHHEEHEWAACSNKEEYLRSMEFERMRRLHALGLVPDAKNNDNKFNSGPSKSVFSPVVHGGFATQ